MIVKIAKETGQKVILLNFLKAQSIILKHLTLLFILLYQDKNLFLNLQE